MRANILWVTFSVYILKCTGREISTLFWRLMKCNWRVTSYRTWSLKRLSPNPAKKNLRSANSAEQAWVWARNAVMLYAISDGDKIRRSLTSRAAVVEDWPSAGGGDKRQGDGIGRWRPTQSRCTTSTSTDCLPLRPNLVPLQRTCHPRSPTLELSVHVFMAARCW